ncbi:ABC transporter permease [Plantactinospora endophytica]|uniref:Autoinducer 2 import system permease protein LsrC n=1 Tax=Plantactinospora endophytica TaxID=673535 RepID=A0ABQ4EA06_9ACTN|nr:ABC transporter permease [Plantactinospora endophytica]GIG91474.1 sugar ABC transporter permease [Plantactinospora endophytica]
MTTTTRPGAGPDAAEVRARSGAAGMRLGHRLFVAREVGIGLALVLLVGVTTAVNPRFLSGQGRQDLMLGATILVVLAVGQAIVIITRNVDLSVGSILGLAAFATGKLFLAMPDAPIVLAVLVGTGLGVLCGVVNGALIAVARVPALVVTLGTLYVFRGIDYSWAAGQQINAADMPSGFKSMGTADLLGIPLLALFAVAVLLVAGFYLKSYRSGRELYAIGSDPAAARLHGIPVGWRVFGALVVSGGLAGLAGVLYAARYGTLDAAAGTGIELNVVAAVVVGGVAIFGGSGSVYGAALGAVLLSTIGSALPVLKVNPFWQQAVVGALILAAIGLDRALAARVANRLRGRKARGA